MEHGVILPIEKLLDHSELIHGTNMPGPEAYDQQEEESQRRIRVVTDDELPENLKDAMEGSDIADQLSLTQQSHPNIADIDRHALEDYIAHLSEALVPELALLLAERMKDRLRNSDTLRQKNVSRAKVSHDGQEQTTESATHANGRVGKSESIAALRYIVTPDPSNPSICVKQSVGEPQIIPYIPPGIYRENREGKLEMQTSFRRSMVEQKQEVKHEKEAKEDEPTHVAPTEQQGRLRKMMSKVFKKQNRE